MAPMKLKPTPAPNSTAQTLTAADARLLARESIRISADLAASPPATVAATESVGLRNFGFVEEQFVDSSLRLICCEEIDGRRWKYFAESGGSKRLKKGSIRVVSLQRPQAPVEELMSFIRSYVVPEGFPDSVSPSYVPYMTWRALKHFFGGAMGVFTTQTLLSSVGVSKNRATPGAVAINWILKDGAGRIGKMLYSRQGTKFDYDLKQLRFYGDLLMELGAGVELATAAVPHFFLPLACAANVAKNVGAVTSTSTRTPIYKAFAKGENIGDVTAKGECVGNIADLLGTGLGIMIAKRNPSLVTTFSLLSCGYLLSSYQEVKSVVLRTLNRARLTVAIESFLKTGRVPTLQEGNMMESIISLPWSKETPVVLGPRFKVAFQDPNSYVAMEPIFQKERYMVTYNPSKGSIYGLLKDQAKSDDILKAAFHAHVLLHIIRSSNQHQPFPRNSPENDHIMPSISDLDAHIAQSCKMVSALYGPFTSKAREQGWVMSESLLNPGRARLCDTNN
ncbi:Protein root UVB sensitive like [Actinidia chinensis var. chinensis]|uniref:Protein root UVB sensitive like n=1 Tax=Actinidia chinensis var. chinensis TaxID=1590841 RepID=A0A2R6Q254_ACTCC|nr:Protein root UVB sensitive like [Actinidia chinensis var. chinensis]